MAETPSLRDLDRLVHDLKTPVNTIAGRLQMALKRIEDDTARRNVVQAIAGAHNLLRKFYNLYYLVAMDADPDFPKRETVHIEKVWAQASKNWAVLAEVLGITLSGEAPPGLSVIAAGDVLVRMLDNLLSNALLHSREVKLVSLRVEQAGDAVNLMLRNDGDTTGEEGDVEISEPDFSGGFTVNRLGLSAVKALALRLGGGFSARHGAGGSFIATLSLPVGE